MALQHVSSHLDIIHGRVTWRTVSVVDVANMFISAVDIEVCGDKFTFGTCFQWKCNSSHFWLLFQLHRLLPGVDDPFVDVTRETDLQLRVVAPAGTWP